MAAEPGTLIVITGPESSGKTTLAGDLADLLGLPLVSEVARDRLGDRPLYSEQDVCRLALLQFRAIEEARCRHPLAIADTDLLTYRIWLEWRYGHCPDWVRLLHRRQRPLVYLLCAPDLPWEPDPLRENPSDREPLHQVHRAILDAEGMPFHRIGGSGGDRIRRALDALRVIFPGVADPRA